MRVTARRDSGVLRSFWHPVLWLLLLAAAQAGCEKKESAEPEATGLSALVQVGGGIERNGDGEVVFVNLSHCPVTNDQLACLADQKNLQTLWLYETPISDSGLKHLSKLASLEVLVLGKSKVSDFGLIQLGALKNLKELYLYDTNCSEEGVNRLQALLPRAMIMY